MRHLFLAITLFIPPIVLANPLSAEAQRGLPRGFLPSMVIILPQVDASRSDAFFVAFDIKVVTNGQVLSPRPGPAEITFSGTIYERTMKPGAVIEPPSIDVTPEGGVHFSQTVSFDLTSSGQVRMPVGTPVEFSEDPHTQYRIDLSMNLSIPDLEEPAIFEAIALNMIRAARKGKLIQVSPVEEQ